MIFYLQRRYVQLWLGFQNLNWYPAMHVWPFVALNKYGLLLRIPCYRSNIWLYLLQPLVGQTLSVGILSSIPSVRGEGSRIRMLLFLFAAAPMMSWTSSISLELHSQVLRSHLDCWWVSLFPRSIKARLKCFSILIITHRMRERTRILTTKVW